MNFPIQIGFKIFAITPQMSVTEAGGTVIGYVRKKLLAFVEDVTVYADESQQKPIYKIKADRVIDFTANYHFTHADGRPIGVVSRSGMRSLWRAHYIIGNGSAQLFEVHEEKPWARLVDNVVGEIPLIGMLTGLFLNPTYLITGQNNVPVLRMSKRRALLETNFTIDQLGSLDPGDREAALLGLMMIVMLERSRG
jgi:hypothetical protein